MLQTVYGLPCTWPSSVFHWRNRFKDDNKEAREDEWCRRDRNVRAPKLVEKICNFLNENHPVSIKTMVWELWTELFMKFWTCGKSVKNLFADSQWRSEGNTRWWTQQGGWWTSQLSFTLPITPNIAPCQIWFFSACWKRYSGWGAMMIFRKWRILGNIQFGWLPYNTLPRVREATIRALEPKVPIQR